MPNALTIHASAGAALAVFLFPHIAHHFIGGVFKDPQWHEKVQDRYMPRGLVEVLGIGVPAAATLTTGVALCWRSLSGIRRSWVELFGSRASRGEHLTVESECRSKIRRLQLVSGSILGFLLTGHSAAVLFLRYARGGKAINLEIAAHNMHDPAAPFWFRMAFTAYYAVFIESFFVHALSGLAANRVKAQQLVVVESNTDNKDTVTGKKPTSATTATPNYWWWSRVVVPFSVAGGAVAASTVIGIFMKTSAESTAAHWPF